MRYERYVPKSEWERAVLKYNPFEGDFGETSDLTFKDRIVRGRGQFSCQACCGMIAVGELHRYIVLLLDGQLFTYRYCNACCEGMVGVWRGDWRTLEARYALRRTSQPS